MFESGAKVQVVKKGLFSPARANKLYDLYLYHNSLDDIDPELRREIQDKYFKRSFDEVWRETKAYYAKRNPSALAEMENSPKRKMAAIFKWYFVYSTRLALSGNIESKMDYQIHCGPALGAFNQRVRGGRLELCQKRYLADVAEYMMQEAATLMTKAVARYRPAA